MLCQVDMLAVAAPDHPLNQGEGVVSELELSKHRQVVLRDSGARQEQNAGWLQAEQRWTVSHFSSSIKIVKNGLAFAFLPSNWIREELASGELIQLPLEESLSRKLPLYLLLADREAAGPATRALYEMIHEALGTQRS